MVGFRGRRDRELTEEERSAFCGSAMQHRTQISNVYRERAKECRTLAKTGFAQFRADFCGSRRRMNSSPGRRKPRKDRRPT